MFQRTFFGGLFSEGLIFGGFIAFQIWGLIFGGACFRNFMVFKYSKENNMEFNLLGKQFTTSHDTGSVFILHRL